MSMENEIWYDERCPQCGSAALNVVVQAWATLSPDGTEVFGSHDWDGDSLMQCDECTHMGEASLFVYEKSA